MCQYVMTTVFWTLICCCCDIKQALLCADIRVQRPHLSFTSSITIFCLFFFFFPILTCSLVVFRPLSVYLYNFLLGSTSISFQIDHLSGSYICVGLLTPTSCTVIPTVVVSRSVVTHYMYPCFPHSIQ